MKRGRGCYQAGCDHPECAQANRDYARRYQREVYYPKHQDEQRMKARAYRSKKKDKWGDDPMKEWLA